ncbi:DUF3299 domain-containing protein [Gammaproteobacteria bacterium]|nr:DUF3299 domain-containing protein [Gammaproteobacteria bacterium]
MRYITLLRRYVITVVVATCAAAHAGEAQRVEWHHLVDPSAQNYEDPYRDLNYQQIDLLSDIVVETAKIEKDRPTGERLALSESRIVKAKQQLAEHGVDADWLIAQRWVVAEHRKTAATATNPTLDGLSVSVAGFAIAAPADDDGTKIVYLVPGRGMCSHTPPPDANQMIRARINGNWSPSAMHEPVRLSGMLSAHASDETLIVLDGAVSMRSSYLLEVANVETIGDLRAPPQTSFGSVISRADRLRASVDASAL